MLPKKNVTEEDLKVTETGLAESYASLKQALTSIPSDAVRPFTDTVREHPYVSVAVAATTGYLAFRLLSMFFPRTKYVTHEVSVQPEIEVKEVGGREGQSLFSRLLSQVVSLVTPYVMGYVQSEVSKLLSRPKEGETTATGPEEVT